MDIEALRLWAKKMGYQGRVDDFGVILNASTEHIWKQVIERVRPWQESQEIRSNIIIQKMKYESDGALIPPAIPDCPIQEIEMWQANKELLQVNKQLKLKLQEGKKELSQLEFSQNMLKAQIAHSECKLKEEKCKEYFYRMKNKHLIKEMGEKHQQLTDLQLILTRPSTSEAISLELMQKDFQQSEDLEEMQINKVFEEFYKKHCAANICTYLRSQENKHFAQIRTEIDNEQSSSQDYINQCQLLHEDNVIAMQMQQIENELEARELRRKYLLIQKECNDHENAIIEKFENNVPSNVEDFRNFLNEKAAEIERNLAIKLYSQEIQSLTLKKTPEINNELKQTLFEIRQAQEQLETKYKEITEKQVSIVKLDTELDVQRTKSRNMLENVRKFVGRNNRTLEVLKSKQYSKEIELFSNYRLTNIESSTTFPYTSIPNLKDTLRHVISAIEFPITDEKNLLAFFRKKYARFVCLTQLPKVEKDFTFKKCHPSVLGGDSLVNNCTLEQLRQLSSDAPSMRDHERALEIWKELPFADCISSELLRDGHGYKHYEEVFLSYLNQLNKKS